MSSSDSNVSFLNESQSKGKSSGKVAISNLDEVIGSMCSIINEDEAKRLSGLKEAEFPTLTQSVYCHDCRDIVVAGTGKGRKGKPRVVCGLCNSRKISLGRDSALRTFYHLPSVPSSESEPEESKK